MAAGCETVFEETISGGARDRPQLRAALASAAPGSTLVVWKLDHLARSTRQLIETIEDLESGGVHFLSLREQIDTGTPAGRFLFTLTAGIATFEREMIRERTIAGLEAARARGRFGGRSRLLGDYELNRARSLLDADLSVQEVARHLGCATSTLYRSLSRSKAETQHSLAVA